jgi:hypothetical protein
LAQGLNLALDLYYQAQPGDIEETES